MKTFKLSVDMKIPKKSIFTMKGKSKSQNNCISSLPNIQ